VSYLISTIPLWSLLSGLCLGLFGRKLSRRWAGVIAVAGPLCSLLTSAGLCARQQTAVYQLHSGFSLGAWKLSIAFSWDPLSAVMVLLISGVGLLLAIYFAGYLARETQFARYFAYLNLFTAMMLLLVLGDDLPLMYLGWLGAGLCGCLLVGFRFRDPELAAPLRRAFLLNRIGDLAFLLAMLLIFQSIGSLSFRDIPGSGLTTARATALTLLLCLGAIGKSALIPLSSWSPDATPAPALIHSTTMLAAGVYLIARMRALFELAPMTGLVIALIGAATAFYAARLALAQYDLKKLLAYSTISQLGYTFVAMGLGAHAAGMFHLLTHASFNMLLLLGAGVVLRALGDEQQDIRRMGGLRHALPSTFICFGVGAIALAGLPPLAGFWSKELILEAALTATRGALIPPGAAWLIYGLCLGGALLTAFYSVRMLRLIFCGEPSETDGQQPTLAMAGVMLLLAGLSILGGLLNLPAAAGVSGQLLHHVLYPVLGAPDVASLSALLNLSIILPLLLVGTLAALRKVC